jgi:hypothetical protein
MSSCCSALAPSCSSCRSTRRLLVSACETSRRKGRKRKGRKRAQQSAVVSAAGGVRWQSPSSRTPAAAVRHRRVLRALTADTPPAVPPSLPATAPPAATPAPPARCRCPPGRPRHPVARPCAALCRPCATCSSPTCAASPKPRTERWLMARQQLWLVVLQRPLLVVSVKVVGVK